MIDNVNKWISVSETKKHEIGFNYEIYENIRIPKDKLDSLHSFIAKYILKNYISPKESDSIKMNPHIKDISTYIKDVYIPSNTGNFGLKTGEFGEIISKLIFENKYEFIIYRFHYKEYKDEAVKIYDLVGFTIKDGVIIEVVLFEVKTQSDKLNEEIIVDATNQITTNVVSRILKYMRYIERILTKEDEFELFKMIQDFHLINISTNNFTHKLNITLVCESSIYNENVLNNLNTISDKIDSNIFEISIILLNDIKALRDVCYLKSSECFEEVFGI